MNKKISLLLIILFLVVLTLPSALGATAPDPTGTKAFYGFDDTTIAADDYTTNNNDGTVNGATWTSEGIYEGAYSFDGVDDYIDSSQNPLANIGQNNFSFNVWVKIDESYINEANQIINLGYDENGEEDAIRLYTHLGIWAYYPCEDNSGFCSSFETDISVTSSWTMLTIVASDGNNWKIFVDGELAREDTFAYDMNSNNWDNTVQIGYKNGYWGISGYTKGVIDELSIFDYALSSDEIEYMYANHNPDKPQQWPFVGPSDDFFRKEAVYSARQDDLILLTANNAWTTVIKGNISIDDNFTNYGSTTIQTLTPASGSNTVFACRTLVNGSPSGDMIERTNIPGRIGSMNLLRPDISTAGNYDIEVQCQKNGSNTYIGESVGVGHVFNNTNITTSDFLLDYNISSNDQLLESFNFNSSYDGFVIFEYGASVVDGNATASVSMSFNASDGQECDSTVRDITAGTTGAVGDVCAIKVEKGVPLDIDLRGFIGASPNPVLVEGEAHVKILSSANSTALDTNIVITENFTLIGSVDVNNSELLDKVYMKANVPVSAFSTVEDINLQFAVDGSLVGSPVPYTVIGRITQSLQQFVADAPDKSNFTVELYAYADSTPGSDIYVEGGNLLSYTADNYPIDSGFFEIRAFNFWDNSSIQNFTVTDGLTRSTTDGVLTVFTDGGLDNLTISSSGYFDTYYEEWNTSNDLNATLRETDIKFIVSELISNDLFYDFNFTIDGVTKNSTESFYLAEGSYNVTASNNDYFNLTREISVSSLDNTTLTLQGAYNAILNISAFDRINLITINNFSGYYNYKNGLSTFLDDFSTTDGYVELPAVDSYDYFVDLDVIEGYSTFGDSENFTVNPLDIINYTFLLYTNNSINYTINDFSTGDLLLQNVNITMVGSNVTYNFNTANGILYVDNLNDDTYKTTFSSSGYSDIILYQTIHNNGHLNTEVNMQSGLVNKIFNVQDNTLNPVADATLTFSTIVNGSSIIVGQAKTDFSGTANIFLDENTEYNFIVQKTGYETFTGSVIPTESSYTITLNTEGADIFTSVFDDVVYLPLFSYNSSSGIISSDLIVSSSEGSIEYFGLYTDYTGSRVIDNTSLHPAGGTASISIPGITNPDNKTITITYFFKSSGYDVFIFNQSYYLSDVEGFNTSLSGGLFNDIQDIDENEPVRGFLGAIIVLVMVLIFMTSTGNFSVGVIGGIIGIAINNFTGLWPANLSIIAIIVAVIMLIADNVK